MTPELQAIVEWSKLGVNVLYLGAIVYLFKDLRKTQEKMEAVMEKYAAGLLALIERYHTQTQKSVEAFESLLREVTDDRHPR